MIATIEYKLQPINTSISPIYIGNGLGGAGIKRMLRKSTGKKESDIFLIPGSTIKGRLRNCCRQYIEYHKEFSRQDIEFIFGMPGDQNRGKTSCSFSDLRQIEPEEFLLELRNGIQISRKLGITKPHALFNTEIIYCKSFEGKIIFRHQPNNNELSREKFEKCLALLIISLRMLRRLGGSKTVGLGKFEVPLKEIKIREGSKKIEVDQLLQTYLEGKTNAKN